MKIKLATWYMEWLYVRMSVEVQGYRVFHYLMHLAFDARRDQYAAQILVMAHQGVRV